MRSLEALAIAATIGGLLAGCAGLPTGQRLADGPAAQRAVARVIGSPMTRAPTEVTPTGIDGQSFTYVGSSHGAPLTLIVFDNSKATRFVLGPQVAKLRNVNVLRSRNIVVFYTPPPNDPSLGSALQRALNGVK